jgi:putative spermidine/putrescine transport system permease protein
VTNVLVTPAPDNESPRGSAWHHVRRAVIRADHLRYGLLALPLTAFLALFFAGPIGSILVRSFAGPDQGLSLGNYEHLIEQPVYLTVLLNTFSIAATVTLSCLVLGYPLAFLLATSSTRLSRLLTMLVIISFWVSLLARTYSWIILLGRSGIINRALMALGLVPPDAPLPLIYNALGAHIGMIHILLPFMVLSLLGVMKGIDPAYVQAALSLGANRLQAFWRVYLPLSLPGVTAGCLLVFIMALGFFVTPAILGGPKQTMVAMLISTLVQQLLDWGLASSLAAVLLAIALVLFFLYNRLIGLDNFLGGA